MSSTVDNRVVSMSFDNRAFESNVKTSVNTLDKLKNSLNLSNSAKGLDEVNAAAKRVSFAGMANGIDTLKVKFSALQIVGVTAMVNLSNQAMNAGKRMISALTIDPIKMGFNDYETKMNAIQVIQTNTQGGQTKVTQAAGESLKATASSAKGSTEAVRAANDDAVTSLQKTQEENARFQQKTADAELKLIEDKYAKESDALDKSIRSKEYLEQVEHDKKLRRYDEEYMKKLKIMDEDKYNQIKGIDDQIKNIDAASKADADAREKKRQAETLSDLQARIASAKTAESKADAEKRLADYLEDLDVKRISEERDNQKTALNDSKDAINEQFKVKKEKAKEEYDAGKEKEARLYNLKTEFADRAKDDTIKNLKDAFELEKEKIKEKSKIEKQALDDKQRDEMAAIQKKHEASMAASTPSGGGGGIVSSGGGGATTTTVTKASTLEDINKALADLNDYSDKTIYNFADMSRNMGTFTAAGVDLETSATSIKGIGNLAAASGSNSQQAATAMYQLSQAIAAGKVGLQDWNSVVNAGMGGQLFQNALEKTAEGLGRGRNMAKSFRESLEDGWITADVLTTTLSRMAADPALLKAATQVKTYTQLTETMQSTVTSGWAKSFESIIGGKDEATLVFTAINDGFGSIIGPSIEARNAMLKFWHDNGGRDALIDTLSNAFNNLLNIGKAITSAFREIFPATTGRDLISLTKSLRTLVDDFTLSEKALEGLHNTFKGLFAVVDIGVQIIMFFVKAIGIITTSLFPVTGSLLTVTGGIGNFLVAIDDAIKNGDVFSKVLDGLVLVMGIVSLAVLGVTSVTGSFIDKIKEFIQTATILEDTSKWISGVFNGLTTSLKGVSKSVPNSILEDTSVTSVKLTKNLGGLTRGWDGVRASTSVTGEEMSNVEYKFRQIGSYLSDTFGPAIGFVVEKLKSISLGDIGLALAGGGIVVIAKKLKDTLSSLDSVTSGFSDIISGITGSLEAFQTKLKADALFKIAMAIGLLAVSIVVLSMIDPDALTKALIALTVVFTELSVGLMLLQGASLASPGLSGKLIALGIAIAFMASAIKKLSDLDKDKMANGVQGLASILTVLAVFIKFTSGASMTTGMAGLIGIAIAVNMLCGAIAIFGNIDPKVMEKGIQGLAASLTTMAVFIKVIGNPQHMLAVGIGILAISAAMIIFAGAITLFGLIPDDILIKGVVAVGALLLMLATATEAMQGTIAGAAAIVILVGAINMLVPAMVILGSLSLATIGTALLALAGVFIILGLSAFVLRPLAPVILSLAASIGLIGIGVYLLGGGLILFATGLAALAAGGAVFIAAFIAATIAIWKAMPEIAKAVKTGLIAISKAIAEATPSIVMAIEVMVLGLIKLIEDLSPPLIESTLKIILVLLEKMEKYIYPMTDAACKLLIAFGKGILDNIKPLVAIAVEFILKFIDGINSKLASIVDVAFKFVIGFINGLTTAINNNSEALNKAVGALMNALVKAAVDFLPILAEVGENIIKGIIKGVSSMGQAMYDATKGVITDAVDGVKNFLGIKSPSRLFASIGEYSGQGFINGLNSYSSKSAMAGEGIGKEAINAMSNSISGISDVIQNGMDFNPTIRPVLDLSNVTAGMRKVDGAMNDYSLAGSVNLARTTASSRNYVEDVKATNTNNSNSSPTTTPFGINIEKFINNREQDVEAFAEEFEFYRRQKANAIGG